MHHVFVANEILERGPVARRVCITGLAGLRRVARVVQWLTHLLDIHETWVRIPIRGVLFSPFESGPYYSIQPISIYSQPWWKYLCSGITVTVEMVVAF